MVHVFAESVVPNPDPSVGFAGLSRLLGALAGMLNGPVALLGSIGTLAACLATVVLCAGYILVAAGRSDRMTLPRTWLAVYTGGAIAAIVAALLGRDDFFLVALLSLPVVGALCYPVARVLRLRTSRS